MFNLFEVFIYMKWFLFTFFIFIGFICMGQDGFYLTNEQHIQLKKNLADYRILIKNYEIKSEEFDKLTTEYFFLKNLYTEQKLDIETLKKQVIESHNLYSTNINLTIENKKLITKVESMQREIGYKNKSLFSYQTKYLKLLNTTKGERIVSNIFWSIMVSGALIVIYTDIEAKYIR